MTFTTAALLDASRRQLVPWGRRKWAQPSRIRRPPGPACGKAWEAFRTETVRKEASKPVLVDWGLGVPSDPMSPRGLVLLVLFIRFPAHPPWKASRKWECATWAGSECRNLPQMHFSEPPASRNRSPQCLHDRPRPFFSCAFPTVRRNLPTLSISLATSHTGSDTGTLVRGLPNSYCELDCPDPTRSSLAYVAKSPH